MNIAQVLIDIIFYKYVVIYPIALILYESNQREITQ